MLKIISNDERHVVRRLRRPSARNGGYVRRWMDRRKVRRSVVRSTYVRATRIDRACVRAVRGTKGKLSCVRVRVRARRASARREKTDASTRVRAFEGSGARARSASMTGSRSYLRGRVESQLKEF